MTWIPSRVYFEFCATALLTYTNAITQVVKAGGKGVAQQQVHLSGLFGHLARHVVTGAGQTPSWLQLVLDTSKLTEELERSNMRFLRDYDYDKAVLHGLLQDTEEARRMVGAPLGEKPQQQVKWLPAPMAEDAGDESEYPFGQNVTKREMDRLLADQPDQFVRQYIHKTRLDKAIDSDAVELFVLFTNQVYNLLLPGLFLNKRPFERVTSLEAAMRCWSVAGIRSLFLPAHFEVFNDGLMAPAGRSTGKAAIEGYFPLWFPQPSGIKAYTGNHWKSWLGKHGYISRYHRLLKKADKEEQDFLTSSLLAIFAELQCLPVSQPRVGGLPGAPWMPIAGADGVQIRFRLRSTALKVVAITRTPKITVLLGSTKYQSALAQSQGISASTTKLKHRQGTQTLRLEARQRIRLQWALNRKALKSQFGHEKAKRRGSKARGGVNPDSGDDDESSEEELEDDGSGPALGSPPYDDDDDGEGEKAGEDDEDDGSGSSDKDDEDGGDDSDLDGDGDVDDDSSE